MAETMTMHWLDWVVVALFFVLVLWVGIRSGKNINSSTDFFVGGGKIPWWMSGISPHVSGYSGVVFVGYAGIAYAQGMSIYFWWAVNIALATALASVTIIPRWPRLRRALGIESPTEYLQMRYNRAAQLLIAISGIGSKLLDVAAKWTSIGILLHGFTGMPIWVGVIVSGLISLIYIAIGGILADLWTDFIQFIVQVIAGLALFIGVIMKLGDYGLSIFSVFSALPEANVSVFNAGPRPRLSQLDPAVLLRYFLQLQWWYLEPGCSLHFYQQRQGGQKSRSVLRSSVSGLAVHPVLPHVVRTPALPGHGSGHCGSQPVCNFDQHLPAGWHGRPCVGIHVRQHHDHVQLRREHYLCGVDP